MRRLHALKNLAHHGQIAVRSKPRRALPMNEPEPTASNPFDPPPAPVRVTTVGRRRRIDRRQEPTPRLSRFSITGGRRRTVQRSEEQEGSFIDRYSRLMLFWILWISLMNLGDSFFTLVHLQAGGIEVNPIADALLRTGRFGFCDTPSSPRSSWASRSP